jgi:hypothetical protein
MRENQEQEDKRSPISPGSKYMRNRFPLRKKDITGRRKAISRDEDGFFQGYVFFVQAETNPFYFGGRVFIFLVILVWGWKFILAPMESNATGSSFLHLVNLPFHEAGHLFFHPLGRWMTSLGGTLDQLLIPCICLLVLLLKSRDPFGASVSLWWLGENFMDIAPYINDARDQKLLLLGGITGREADYGFHDWGYILHEIGWLHYDHTLAHMVCRFGTLLMLISFAWAGYLLYKQYENLDLTSLKKPDS